MVDLSIIINSSNPKGLPACLYWIAQNAINNPLRLEILSREVSPELREFVSVLPVSIVKDGVHAIEVAKAPFLLYILDTMIPWKNSLFYLVNNARHFLTDGKSQFVLPTIYKLPVRANDKLDKYKANLTQKMVDYCLVEPPQENVLMTYATNKETALHVEKHYGLEFKTEVCPEVLFLNQEF